MSDAEGPGYSRKDEILRSLRENRTDYAVSLQREMREFIANEMSELRATLVRNLPSLIRRECLKVLKKALAPGKPEKKRKAAR